MKEELRIALEDLGSVNSKNTSLEDKFAIMETENSNLSMANINLKQKMEEREQTEEKMKILLEEKEKNIFILAEVRTYLFFLCLLFFLTLLCCRYASREKSRIYVDFSVFLLINFHSTDLILIL